MSDSSILVVIPVFNGEHSILQLHSTLSQMGIRQLLVIDDGSLDATAQILNDNGIPHLSHETNLGKGAAIKSGAKWAIENNFHWILTLDADQQHPPSSIPVFMERMKEGVILIGQRTDLKSMPLLRVFSNTFTSLLLSIRTNHLLRDSQCGFRLIPLSLLKEVTFKQNGFQFESELLIKASYADYTIKHINIPTVYGSEKSAMRNIYDTIKFAAMYFNSFIW
ncbi:MAG TPA: glycosyltransferase family 2 protein [Candidatus Marinimicrobia bacterium]|nr:glycosyltransferase family 2 protein [Candidatus Neomarinimicrobiota bacterium]